MKHHQNRSTQIAIGLKMRMYVIVYGFQVLLVAFQQIIIYYICLVLAKDIHPNIKLQLLLRSSSIDSKSKVWNAVWTIR